MDIEEFMNRISGHESGGNYGARNVDSGAYGRFQIMPGNWPSWSKMAGIPGAPPTPQNQDRVARHMMLSYYNKYRDWGAVAAAWYGGPVAAAKYLANPNDPYLTRKQGKYPSISEYIRRITGGAAPRMNNAAQGYAPTGGPLPGAGLSANLPNPLKTLQQGLAGAMSGTGSSVSQPKFDPNMFNGDLISQALGGVPFKPPAPIEQQVLGGFRGLA